jgi:hypothetical protein
MTTYILTAYNNSKPITQGSIQHCFKWMIFLVGDLTVSEAMMWYRIDKQTSRS